MPRASDAGRLQALHAGLQRALQAGDWRAVGEVDRAIRACLEALPASAALDEPAQAARQRLKRLHGEALKACGEECERLRLLLVNHLDYAEGRAAYQRTEMLQMGDPA
ncbi:hypothetical protein BAY1663_03826 [Pseudomonas sp. BAY1663]|uniref:Flagellar protein FliT n=1 Tax=Stutzerimonas stutzeri TaxID=316 RepID=A0A2N8T9H1_STUST|nr:MULTISPECIES: hypothetical protein [Pseudomonadaceae]EXF43778.1 hypothetical protein BAY1663_03826 [Pseudomonas sp. BAY1663]MCQ4327252.1 hypothetical protein [Stutzerimonas stutzeri]PNG11407.1 hypothetical protein CXK94_02180 [Stutzerimonas stutzeri]